ncbi:MAG: serine--tRNA ligase [Alphaproteobacteria bacterium]
MFDMKLIREDPEAFDAALARRGFEPKSAAVLELDQRLRTVLAETQTAQAARNEASKKIGKAKAGGSADEAEAMMAEVARLKTVIQDGEEQERRLQGEIEGLLAGLPNLPYADIPDGTDETGNVERHRVAGPRNYEAPPKEHWDLFDGSPLMDFETAAKMSGSRFALLRGGLARLERALAAFMLDLHTGEHGYTEVVPPVLVRDEAVYGTGQLPKLGEDMFRTENGFWLIPTSEVSLTNTVMDTILKEDDLPIRMTAHTPCFRSEAGAAGRDQRGLIRLHQFSKVELVSITAPDHSEAEHERMLACAEAVLKRLDLSYRVMTLCAGDMGFSARRTYDIEVWLPGQNTFREISSCSTCGDFQARRMNARYRPAEGKGTRFVHTLNGSGLAVGRTMVAVLETYQNPDGSVTVPDALKPYMGSIERIEAHG